MDLWGSSCTFIWCTHQNFLPSHLGENRRASFSVKRPNSWISYTMRFEV